MSARALARQYANALFDVAQKNGQVQQVQEALSGFSALVASSGDLTRIFGSPAVPSSRKQALVQGLVASAANVPDEVGRLLGLLADRDRLTLVDEVAAAYHDRVMDADQVVRAEITSAVALDEGARSNLERALSQALGRRVTMTERVDPAIVGGLVAKVGSVVFDGSVTRQIDRLRDRLLANTQ
jgi:F-type H+-transporting ATPase subunit delta